MNQPARIRSLNRTWRMVGGVVLVMAWWVAGFAQDSGTLPDLTQTDPRGEFARGGKSYCGPVAVSNSLMWLYREELNRLGLSQYDLVNQLASKGYMNTDPAGGTGPNGVVAGVRQFLRDRGLTESDFTLQFQGWRPHLKSFSTGVSEPDPEWIAEAIGSGGAAWINLGWYRIDPATRQCERVSGHWVTVAGRGKDEEGKENPQLLIIHDPAPRAGEPGIPQKVLLTRLTEGTLVGDSKGLPRPAAGLHRMEGGMVIKETADCAILDGVVALRFRKP